MSVLPSISDPRLHAATRRSSRSQLALWVAGADKKEASALAAFSRILICLPYAGGGASIFRSWQGALPETVEVCRLQLPGRENRLGERPYRALSELIRDCADILLPYIGERYFSFYGHSMGTRIAFELAREMRRRTARDPEFMFMAACNAPQYPEKAPSHALPTAEFLQVLRKIGGTPDDILCSPEIMDIFLPTIRADYAVKETYQYSSDKPFNCQMIAMGGTRDEETDRHGLLAWGEHAQQFSLAMFDAGHFFIKSHQDDLLSIIRSAFRGGV